MDSNLKGIGIALFGALVIVPDTLLMRLSGLSAAQMVAWRGLLMAAALWSVWLVLSRDRRGDLAALATPAGLGAAACQAANASLFAYGIAHAPVAVVLVAVATVPLLSGLLGAVALGDRMTPSTLAASAVVLGGIALSVSGGGGGAGGQGSALFGAVAGLGVAAILAATFTIFRAAPDLPVLSTMGAGALAAGLAAALSVESLTRTDGWMPAIWIAGLVILPVSFTAFNVASRYTVAANVSLLLLLETVLGPLAVWAAIGEAVGPRALMGGGGGVATLAVYLWDQRRRTIRGRRAAALYPSSAAPR